MRAISFTLKHHSQEVGNGRRTNLLIPSTFSDCESIEAGEAWIVEGSPAPHGELVRVDLNLLDDISTRTALCIFIRSAFEPPVIGGGEFRITTDELEKGIVFSRKDFQRDSGAAHA